MGNQKEERRSRHVIHVVETSWASRGRLIECRALNWAWNESTQEKRNPGLAKGSLLIRDGTG